MLLYLPTMPCDPVTINQQEKFMFKNILATGSFIGALSFSMLAFAAPRTVTLNVPGMTCSSCPITVKRALLKVDGVQQAKANYDKREAVVTFDDSKTSVEKITLATTNAGYPSTLKAEK
jgi:mercuric ion binding protein